MTEKIVILTEGYAESKSNKTAISILRYRKDDVVGILDSQMKGKTAADLYPYANSSAPFISSIEEAMEANTIMIGISPAGGKLPAEWHPILKSCLLNGKKIVNGLHEYISDIEELREAAKIGHAEIYDVRKNLEKETATGDGLNKTCLRVHTVGHDCSVGKMVVSLEVDEALRNLGQDSTFVATGQTGIMIKGTGCPIDAVISDFLNGAAEKLIKDNQHHDYILLEGQGSLYNPKFSPVTLGLLHGARPQALIMCYEGARQHLTGLPNYPVSSIPEIIKTFEAVNGIFQDSKVIGIALNAKGMTKEDAENEKEKMRQLTGLPVCDVYTDGADQLANAVIKYREELIENGSLKRK